MTGLYSGSSLGWLASTLNPSCIWIADGSTLERLRKTTKELQEVKGSPLAGKILLLIDALTRRPLEVFYNPEAKANEKTFIDQILAALPKGVC